MATREHRIMIIHFAKALTRETAKMIAKTYELPASVLDKIDDGSPGLTLISALEQRLLISHEEKILNKFCQTLFDLDLDDLAAMIKKIHPNLQAKQNFPPQPIINSSRNSSEVTEGGGVLMPPVSLLHIKQEDERRQNGTHPGPRDVSDATLSELSECIGGEWRQIALESLELKKYQLDQISEDYQRTKEKSFEIFVKWRKKNAGKASPQILLDLLSKRKDVDEDAIEILEKVAGRVNET